VELFSMFALGAAVLAGAVAFSRFQERRRMRSWRSAAGRLNLGDIAERPRQGLCGPALLCTSESLHVRLEHYRRGKYESGTRITVDGFWHGAEPLTLKSEGLGTQLFGREIEIGDPAFDGEVYIQGPARLALAVLDAPARERLARLLRGEVAAEPVGVRATLDSGVLEVHVRDRSTDEPSEKVYKALKGVLTSAHELVAPDDIPTRLIQNLQREPLAGVRLSILSVLAREYALRPEARGALLAALRDRDSAVRLWTAKILGEEGHTTLFELAGSPEDPAAAGAITALGERLPTGRLKVLLERALADRRLETARACIQSLGQRDHTQAEELLLRALGHGDPPMAVAAATALGRVGTVAAVAPLRAEASTLLPNPLRSAARQAIAEIQSRLTGAAPGQLSLAAGEAGALSLAAGEVGELSLTDSEPEAPYASRQTPVEQE
jgi:hypothetical protein